MTPPDVGSNIGPISLHNAIRGRRAQVPGRVLADAELYLQIRLFFKEPIERVPRRGHSYPHGDAQLGSTQRWDARGLPAPCRSSCEPVNALFSGGFPAVHRKRLGARRGSREGGLYLLYQLLHEAASGAAR